MPCTIASLSAVESVGWLVPSSGSSPFLGLESSAIFWGFGSGLEVGLVRIRQKQTSS